MLEIESGMNNQNASLLSRTGLSTGLTTHVFHMTGGAIAFRLAVYVVVGLGPLVTDAV